MPETNPVDAAVMERNQRIRAIIESKPRTLLKGQGRVDTPSDTPTVTRDYSVSSEGDVENAVFRINGVHYDLYKYFEVPISQADRATMNKLRYVSEALEKHSPDVTLQSQALFRIDRTLGLNDSGEKKLNKIYNYFRLRGV